MSSTPHATAVTLRCQLSGRGYTGGLNTRPLQRRRADLTDFRLAREHRLTVDMTLLLRNITVIGCSIGRNESPMNSQDNRAA